MPQRETRAADTSIDAADAPVIVKGAHGWIARTPGSTRTDAGQRLAAALASAARRLGALVRRQRGHATEQK